MLRFRETEIAKEQFYTAKKKLKIWYVNVDNIVISKLVKTKTNSMYLIGYLDKAVRPLVLIMPNLSGYVKTFKVKEGDKDENNDIECESFTVISIDSLLVYENKYYVEVYLDNRAYKIANKQIKDYLDENLFEE